MALRWNSWNISNWLKLILIRLFVLSFPFLPFCLGYSTKPRAATQRQAHPRAIFEVLSPETERFDRTAKFDEYARIDELTDYVLISLSIVRVEHFRRLESGGWEARFYTELNQILRLDNFDISVPLAEIYEDIAIETQGVFPGLSSGETIL